jgi:hypothetical protein
MTVIASWLFNEASSGYAPSTVADSTGNGNDLTIDYNGTNANWTSDSGGNGFELLATPGAAGAPIAELADISAQKINSNDVDGPDVDANNTAGLIGSISVNPVDDQKFLVSDPLPLNRTGGKYWLEWVDGGAGTASIDAGIAVRLIPTTIGPAA